jgi:hypothetical protein
MSASADSDLVPAVTPAEIAVAFAVYVNSRWTGVDTVAFGTWIERLWRDFGPHAPTRPPEAVSVSRVGVEARWYATATALLGYRPAFSPGCYVVPRDGHTARQILSAIAAEREESPAVPAEPPLFGVSGLVGSHRTASTPDIAAAEPSGGR